MIEGGQHVDVIPMTVRFGGTFRSTTSKGLSDLQRRIKEVINLTPQILAMPFAVFHKPNDCKTKFFWFVMC